jgi:hypothetical protein
MEMSFNRDVISDKAFIRFRSGKTESSECTVRFLTEQRSIESTANRQPNCLTLIELNMISYEPPSGEE